MSVSSNLLILGCTLQAAVCSCDPLPFHWSPGPSNLGLKL